MTADKARFAYLYQRYISSACTAAELTEFFSYVSDAANAEALRQMADDHLAQLKAEDIGALDIDWEEVFAQIEKNRKAAGRVIAMPGTTKTRKLTIRWMAAAAVIIIIAAIAYLSTVGVPAKAPSTVGVHANDVAAPKETRAVITLADGSKVYLDSAGTGTLATQANTTVERSADGKIVYQGMGNKELGIRNSEIQYNTLSNPRGSKVIDIQLSDGSHLWLNAGSSVKYPVAFVGNERKVEITGEAYFEVKHDASHPFIVSKGETSVTVLGTHFNVNAYDDEEALRVTLLQGSLKVSNNGNSKVIKPGQQAKAVNGELSVMNDVDTDEVMAWKNGKFYFNEADIQTIMRQVARWYDVDVVYEGKIPEGHFTGKPSRDLSASEILKVVEFSGVKVKIEGKKVTVMQ